MAWRRRAAVGSVFGALVAYVHRPWRMSDALPQDGIDSAFVTWTLLWGGHSVGDNGLSRSGWFNAPIFWPRSGTLAYSDPFLPLAPVYGAVHAVVGRWTVATGLFVTALVAVNLVATYLLTRRLTGRADAAVIAAIAFGVSDFALAQWGHIQIQTLGYLPLGFLLLFALLERPRWWLAVGLGLLQGAMALTAASIALAWAVAAVTATVVVLAFGRPRPRRATWIALALTGVVSAVMVVPATQPYLDLQEEPTFRRPVEDVFSASAFDVLSPTRESTLLPDATLPAAGRGGPERELFPGLSTLVLAAVGLGWLVAGVLGAGRRRRAAPDGDGVTGTEGDDVLARRRVQTWAVVAAGLVCGAVALGHDVVGLPGPYELLHEHVPGFAGLRVSSRFAVVTVLGLALLAAVGFTTVVRRLGSGRARAGLAVAVIAYLVAELAIPVSWTEVDTGDDTLAVYRALDRRPPAPAVELPVIDPAAGAEWARTEATRMLYASIDWDPRFNGYSGFIPPGYAEDAAVLNTFPEPCAVSRARGLGLRWVLVHPEATAAVGTVPSLPDGAASRHGRSWLVDLDRLGPATCEDR